MSWTRYARRTLSRRSLLRGLGSGGAALFLQPFLTRLKAEANGDAPPQKLVLVIKGNGFSHVRDWRRLNHSTPVEIPFSDYAADVPHAPSWARWQEEVVFINGLANKMGAGQGAGHRSHWYALINQPYKGSESPGGISVDAHLAQTVGQDWVFPSLRLGSEGPGVGLAFVNSAAGPSDPLPSQNDPGVAFSELFGVTATDPEQRAAFEEKGLILDALASTLRQAEQSLRGEDRWKLERYLYSVETFQTQQAALTARVEDLRRCAPRLPEAPVVDDVGTLFERQANLAGAALACGLTRIVVLNVGSRSPFERYAAWGFGGAHSMGHGKGDTETRRGGHPGLADTAADINQRVADLILRPLEDLPEGNGTMRDNTTVIHINDNGDQHHAKYDNWPVIMLGNFGGRLRAGGRTVEVPNQHQPGYHSLNQLWNTVCHGMGAPKDDFAVTTRAPRNRTGPLPFLMG